MFFTRNNRIKEQCNMKVIIITGIIIIISSAGFFSFSKNFCCGAALPLCSDTLDFRDDQPQ